MSGVIFKANIIQAKSVLGFNMKFLFVLYIGEILVDKWYLTQAINPKNENIFLLKIAKYWCLLFDEINQSWTCCFLYLYYSIGWGYCLFNSSSSEKEVNEKSETPWYGSQLGDALHFKYGSEKNWQNQQKNSRIFLPCALQKYGFSADPHPSLHTMSVNIKIVQAHSFPIDIVTTGDPWWRLVQWRLVWLRTFLSQMELFAVISFTKALPGMDSPKTMTQIATGREK